MGQTESRKHIQTNKWPSRTKYQCISRDFTLDVITQEIYDSNHRCRICKAKGGLLDLAIIHIYPASTKPTDQRSGGNPIYRDNDSYVSSANNALCVCCKHFAELQTKRGLQKYTVEYLQSLKSKPNLSKSIVH